MIKHKQCPQNLIPIEAYGHRRTSEKRGLEEKKDYSPPLSNSKLTHASMWYDLQGLKFTVKFLSIPC